MKNLLTLLSILILSIGITHAKQLQAHLSYATFYHPQEGAYIETYLSISPQSIHYLGTDNGMYKGEVEITMLFKQGETVVTFDKYVLNSPTVSDTLNISQSFLDQKRIALPVGEYSFDLIIADKNSKNEPYVISEPISIVYNNETIAFSDLQMVDNFKKTEEVNTLSKSGYDLIPYPSNFYPDNKNELIFYSELYNTAKQLGDDHAFLIKYYIESANLRKPMEEFVRIRKMKAKEVNTIFHKFDITNLPSGNYQMVLEIIDQENNMLAQKKSFFQRSNPDVKPKKLRLEDIEVENSFVRNYNSKEELVAYIKGLEPIATEAEKVFIQSPEMHDLTTLKRFFAFFWKERDMVQPEKKWKIYKELLSIVNSEFGCSMRKGYETDRGIIYLKYGKPNTIVKNYDNSAAYPHEIWHYYEVGKHRDGKFVFYTHDLVVGCFELAHSNVPGELSNSKWKYDVYSRNIGSGDVDSDYTDDDDNDLWGNPDDYETPY